jgi:hypothetical protein
MCCQDTGTLWKEKLAKHRPTKNVVAQKTRSVSLEMIARPGIRGSGYAFGPRRPFCANEILAGVGLCQKAAAVNGKNEVPPWDFKGKGFHTLARIRQARYRFDPHGILIGRTGENIETWFLHKPST